MREVTFKEFNEAGGTVSNDKIIIYSRIVEKHPYTIIPQDYLHLDDAEESEIYQQIAFEGSIGWQNENQIFYYNNTVISFFGKSDDGQTSFFFFNQKYYIHNYETTVEDNEYWRRIKEECERK